MNIKTPNTEQLAAIKRYALARGSDWQEQLLADWRTGADVARNPDTGHLLRQVRNNFGPAWLANFNKLFPVAPCPCALCKA